MARWAGRVGWFTVILAICAVLNVVILGFQLREMHSGGVDTHNLAQATADFAQAMKDQAASTKKLVAATETSAKAAQGGASATAKAADAEIKTANAEITAAQAEADEARIAENAQLPQISLYRININGFNDPPQNDGTVKITRQDEFLNSGTAPFKSTEIMLYYYFVDKLPDQRPSIGDVSGQPILLVAPGKYIDTFRPTVAYIDQRNANLVKKLGYVFLVGSVHLIDVAGRVHNQCLAYRVDIDGNGNGSVFSEAGNASYHCRN